MAARGLKQGDLAPLLGSKGRVSEVINGKRSISKAQAKTLADFFHVSAELFIYKTPHEALTPVTDHPRRKRRIRISSGNFASTFVPSKARSNAGRLQVWRARLPSSRLSTHGRHWK